MQPSGVQKAFFFAALALLLCARGARCQGDLVLEPLTEMGESANVILASGVEETAQWLDTFLGGEDAYEGNTGSLLQAEVRTVFNQYDGVTSESSLRARLVLPRTQERLNLIWQSDADETGGQQDMLFAGDYIPVEKPSAFGAALEGILVETSMWKAALRLGVQTKIPPDAFVRFDLRRRWYPATSRVTADNKLYWYAVRGLVNKFRLSLDQPLGDGWMARPSAAATWEEDVLGYKWDAGSGFSVRANEKDMFLFDARVSGTGVGEPVVDSYALTAELSHRLYSNWIYIGIGPGATWARERDFAPAIYMAFRFELIFSSDLIAECEKNPSKCGQDPVPDENILPSPGGMTTQPD